MITETDILADEGKTLLEITQFGLSRMKAFRSVLEKIIADNVDEKVIKCAEERLNIVNEDIFHHTKEVELIKLTLNALELNRKLNEETGENDG